MIKNNPEPIRNVTVDFEKRGVNQTFVMKSGPKLLDGTPAPAQTTLDLAGEGQTLIDLVRQA